MRSDSKPDFNTLVILSGALHFSHLILVFVVFFLANQGDWVFTLTPADESKALITGVLALVALLHCAFVALFPLLPILKPVEDKASQNQLGSVEVPPLLDRLFLNYHGAVDQVLVTRTIIRLALAESITLFGFVISILNQSPLFILPFFFLGFGLQFVFGPIYGKFFRKI